MIRRHDLCLFDAQLLYLDGGAPCFQSCLGGQLGGSVLVDLLIADYTAGL